MGAASLVQSLDQAITELVASWNTYSTGLASFIIGILIYRIVSSREPDVHPVLLARQAEHNRIRMPGESPIYSARYTENLLTGLNVRDAPAPGQKASPWTRGKDGDLRDVWRQFLLGAEPVVRLQGPVQGETQEAKRKRGGLVTVLGRSVIEHKLEDVNHQVSAIGTYIAFKDAKRVAIYLPNSVEFVAAVFACAYKLVSPILIPPGQSPSALVAMLRDADADTVIAEAGVFPVDTVAAALPGLRHVIWVVNEGNKHLDWTTPPTEHVRDVATWQDIVAACPPDDSILMHDRAAVPADVVTFWHTRDANGVDSFEAVSFSQANLVAGIAGQIDALPTLTPDDVVFPADSLASAHTLVVTLAALYSNTTVVLNAAACREPDLALLTYPHVLCPTVVVASPATLIKAHDAYATTLSSSVLARLAHWSRTKKLLAEGRMPPYSTAARGDVGSGSGLRLIVVADRAGSGATPALSPTLLSDLRAFLGARIVYAMAARGVAGAVAQTSAFDYRVVEGERTAHFGAPLRCLRYMLRDSQNVRNTDDKYQGEIHVRGPCVVGGEAGLGVMGTVRFDNTLAYI